MHRAEDEQQILKLFEDGDRALVAADLTALSSVFTDDYIQYDESGKASSKSDIMDRLQKGEIRFVAMISTGRSVRFLTADVAIVHGSEIDEMERENRRFRIGYRYMDVVIKREARWQIAGSQLVKTD